MTLIELVLPVDLVIYIYIMIDIVVVFSWTSL